MKFKKHEMVPNTYRVISRGYYGDGDMDYIYDSKFKNESGALKAAIIHGYLQYHETQAEAVKYFRDKLGIEVSENDIPFGYDFESTPSIDSVVVIHCMNDGSIELLEVGNV